MSHNKDITSAWLKPFNDAADAKYPPEKNEKHIDFALKSLLIDLIYDLAELKSDEYSINPQIYNWVNRKGRTKILFLIDTNSPTKQMSRTLLSGLLDELSNKNKGISVKEDPNKPYEICLSFNPEELVYGLAFKAVETSVTKPERENDLKTKVKELLALLERVGNYIHYFPSNSLH